MRIGVIYKIINLLTNKVYIGQTIVPNPRNRWYSHISSAINQKTDWQLSRSIRKHGKENFKFEIIKPHIPRPCLDCLEIVFIHGFDSYKNGYNLTKGGNSVLKEFRHTDESKAKLRASRLGKKWTGPKRIRTPEFREKLRQANLGKKRPYYKRRPRSEESKKRQAEKMREIHFNHPEIFEKTRTCKEGTHVSEAAKLKSKLTWEKKREQGLFKPRKPRKYFGSSKGIPRDQATKDKISAGHQKRKALGIKQVRSPEGEANRLEGLRRKRAGLPPMPAKAKVNKERHFWLKNHIADLFATCKLASVSN